MNIKVKFVPTKAVQVKVKRMSEQSTTIKQLFPEITQVVEHGFTHDVLVPFPEGFAPKMEYDHE